MDTERRDDAIPAVLKPGRPIDRARAVDRAGRGKRFACDDVQQRRLARSIALDQAGTLSTDLQSQIMDERSTVRRGGGEVGEREEARHRYRGGRKGQGGWR